jgi:hypothetical protein
MRILIGTAVGAIGAGLNAAPRMRKNKSLCQVSRQGLAPGGAWQSLEFLGALFVWLRYSSVCRIAGQVSIRELRSF